MENSEVIKYDLDTKNNKFYFLFKPKRVCVLFVEKSFDLIYIFPKQELLSPPSWVDSALWHQIGGNLKSCSIDCKMASRTVVLRGRGIVILASELASAVGRHKYVSKEETFKKVWSRADPESFCFAHASYFKSDIVRILTENDQFPLLKDEIDSVDFASAMRNVICESSCRTIYAEIKLFLNAELFPGNKVERLLVTARVEEQIASQVESLCQNENKPVASAVKEICEKAGVKKKEVIDGITSKMSKDRGTQLESKAVDGYRKAKGIDIKRPIVQPLHYKEMQHGGIKWSVCGKVDDETEDSIIEVKNRVNRFMCPDYDYIQLQTYLFIRNKPKGVLLERLRGENKVTYFGFNEELWKELTVELADFVSKLLEEIKLSREALYGSSLLRKREHPNGNEYNIPDCQNSDGEPLKKTALEG